MRSTNIIVRGAIPSDLPSIERHYGPLDNVGDPFCDVTKIKEVRFDWLVIGEIASEYAGFLYWHLGGKPFFVPHVESFAHIREVQVLEKFQGQWSSQRTHGLRISQAESTRGEGCVPSNSRD